MKAVIIEDQLLVVAALTDVLAISGINVVAHLRDIPDAFDWLDENAAPDIAIVDIALPSGRCFPVIDRLCEADTAVLLVTSLEKVELPSRYQALPYLEKPFGTHELRNALTQLTSYDGGEL